MTTINDYTFVTNRSRIANMDESSSPDASNGVFFYLDQLAYSQVYTLRYYDNDPSNDQTSAIDVPNRIGLINSTFASATGIPSATEAVIRQANGITYRLTVIRQQVLEQEPDGGDDYDVVTSNASVDLSITSQFTDIEEVVLTGTTATSATKA